jgi:amino acid adenylation domain-containing protein
MFDKFDENILLLSSKFLRQKEYWLTKLSGDIVETKFLSDGNRTHGSQRNPKEIEINFTGQLYGEILKLCKESDHSIYMVLLTALKSLIYLYTGIEDIIVLSPLCTQNISSQTLNKTLVIRDQVRGDIGFKELLLKVRQSVLDAYENQDYPYDKLVQHIFNVKNPDGGELPSPSNILCALKNVHEYQEVEAGGNIEKIIFLFARGNQYMKGSIRYDSTIYKSEVMEKLSDYYLGILEQGLRNLDTTIFEISYLKETEKKKLLNDFNDTETRFPEMKTLHQAFEKQVEKTPDRIGIVFEDHYLTYRELNRRANQLARVLRTRGVHADDIVALMFYRSVEMAVCMLAVLKAGGGYLPVEPGIPEKRVISMMTEGRASVLLTRKTLLNESEYAYANLQGLSSADMEIRRTPPRPQVTDLDSLPIPDRSYIDMNKYTRYMGQFFKYSISLQATRGCPYNCAYCFKIWPKTHFFRSAEHLFKEVQIYYNMGIRRFLFLDDIFNLNIKNSRRFFQLIIENGLNVQFFLLVRGDILTEDYIDLIVKAGVVQLRLSLETASPRLQKLIGKNLNITKLHRIIKYVCEKYPEVVIDLNTMIGFPTESEEEAMITLDFIKSMKWLDFPYIHVLKIYQNTDMERLALENGISREQILRSEELSYHELPETLPFEKSFVLKYQTKFLNEYFLSKQRLLYVLPHQMRIMNEEQMLNKYNSYLSIDFKRFDELLEFFGIGEEELKAQPALDKEFEVPDMDERIRKYFRKKNPCPDALKVLLVDLSQHFSGEGNIVDAIVESPIGLMYLMACLDKHFGDRINGRIIKAKVDFDNFNELKAVLEEFEPDVIGIRTLTNYKHFFHRALEMIRLWGFRGPLLVGGPHATNDYRSVLQDRNVDLVILGEGEITFVEVIEKIRENGGKLPADDVLTGIKGLAYVPEEIRSRRRRFTREIILVDEFSNLISRESETNPVPITQPGNLAYIMFTSGSTGKPKGVMVEHRNALNVVQWFARQYCSEQGSHVLQMSNYTFDPSVNQVFGTLLHGAVLYMIDKELLADISAMRRYIDTRQIHVLNHIPTILSDLLCDKSKLASVNVVLSGGEALSESIKDNILDQGYTLYNQYGPTEATIDALVGKCSVHAVTLGKPIANNKCYILNSTKKLVPIGVPGELYIAGAGVARGYCGSSDLTVNVFVPNPFSQGERMYRTGDRARWLRDGNVEFLGRMDHQVKIRGVRIELGEIENHLLRIHHIKDAAVLAHEFTTSSRESGQTGEKYLCAYVVTDELDVKQLKNQLSSHLPEYMIPLHFVQLSEIPRTPSGKVNKWVLPTLDLSGVKDFIPPVTAKEKKFAAIWADVLNIDISLIGMNANFFELGGHSLKATILISRIHKAFNVRIPLAELFRTPTIRELSAYITAGEKDRFEPIEPAEAGKYYTASSAQKRLYFLQKKTPQSTSYNMPKAFLVEGSIKMEKLEKALKELTLRHEILRTSIELLAGEQVQKIHHGVDIYIEYYEPGKENRETAFTPTSVQHALKDFIKPFDPGQIPLFRAGLIDIGDGKQILIFDMHHIVTDGFSMGILTKEFIALYDETELPSLKLQYRDYAQWQEKQRTSEKIKQHEDYWLKQFEGGIPRLNLPVDYSKEHFSFEGGAVKFLLEEEDVEGFSQIVNKRKSTLFMLILSIFYIFLAKITNQEDIVIGTVTDGRTHPDLETIVGMFVNTLALRSFPRGDKTFSEFFDEVQENTLAAFQNQDYQFEDMVKRVGAGNDKKRNPVFDVMFSYITLGDRVWEDSQQATEFRLIPYEIETGVSHFDLMLGVIEEKDNIVMLLEYSTELFELSTIEEFKNDLKEIIHQVVENRDIKLNEIMISNDLLLTKQNILQSDYSSYEF